MGDNVLCKFLDGLAKRFRNVCTGNVDLETDRVEDVGAAFGETQA